MSAFSAALDARLTLRPVSSDTISTRSSSRRIELDVRAEADGRVQRLRAIVKEIERPDVDGAAGEIDSCRCGRSDVHGTL